MRKARQGADARPTRPPFFFNTGQWLAITLLAVTVIGVFGFLAGILMWE